MFRPGWLAACGAACLLAASAARADDFTLSSPDLQQGGTVPLQQVYQGCGGQNISPALAWSGAPASAKSLALTVYDPDAPTGSGFWHWVLFDIPATATGLPKDAGNPARHLTPPGAVSVRSDYGPPGYGGPCPPEGDKPHRYIFTLFAVDLAKLPVDAGASPAVVGFNLHFHTIARTTLTATYGH